MQGSTEASMAAITVIGSWATVGIEGKLEEGCTSIATNMAIADHNFNLVYS